MTAPKASDRDPQLEAFRRAVRAKIARDIEQETRTAERLRGELLPRLAAVLDALRKERRCGRAWLFGSFAWGTPTDESDVDLLVEARNDPVELAAVVGSAVGRLVHLVRLDEAPGSLVERAQQDGVRV